MTQEFSRDRFVNTTAGHEVAAHGASLFPLGDEIGNLSIKGRILSEAMPAFRAGMDWHQPLSVSPARYARPARYQQPPTRRCRGGHQADECRRFRRFFPTYSFPRAFTPLFLISFNPSFQIEKNRRNRRKPAISVLRSVELSAGNPSLYPPAALLMPHCPTGQRRIQRAIRRHQNGGFGLSGFSLKPSIALTFLFDLSGLILSPSRSLSFRFKSIFDAGNLISITSHHSR